jgi:regulator of protease activity HflC (stomatin/prohibitin superfamily)
MSNTKLIVTGVVGALVLIGALMAGIPVYKVWKAEKTGEAEYAQAEQNRRIKILEAQAAKESATLNAEAEVEKAKGLAQANAIVAEGLEGHDEYLRYLWITHLESGEGKEVIYIPTEAGLPILEAGKR